MQLDGIGPSRRDAGDGNAQRVAAAAVLFGIVRAIAEVGHHGVDGRQGVPVEIDDDAVNFLGVADHRHRLCVIRPYEGLDVAWREHDGGHDRQHHNQQKPNQTMSEHVTSPRFALSSEPADSRSRNLNTLAAHTYLVISCLPAGWGSSVQLSDLGL